MVEMHLKLQTLTLGPFQGNCYMVCGRDGSGVVIDPGEDAARLIGAARAFLPFPKAILLTHGHLDHVGAAKDLAADLGIPVYLNSADQFLLDTLGRQYLAFGLPPSDPPEATLDLDEGQELSFGALKVKVIHTPGHSPGGCCFLVGEGPDQELFSGDVLFASSVGRTDLWGGDADALYASLGRLMALPPETPVHPGHGPETTIGDEARDNPYIQQLDEV